jgi:biopolymer transport protein ExbD
MNIPPLGRRKRARIEIIPLIDIMFFLLATFVMVSLSMIKNRGIGVILPAAATGASQDRKDYVTITVKDTGQLYLDKQEMEEDRIIAQLRQLKAANPDIRVFINGDENARLGLAITILDDVRKAGIEKVTFETRPKS